MIMFYLSNAYAPLVSKVVTVLCMIPLMKVSLVLVSRSVSPGDNPKTALHEYLKLLKDNDIRATDGGKLDFEIDKNIEAKM